MEEEQLIQQQMQNEENKTDVAFLQGASSKDNETVFSKHLQPSQILEQIEKLLMGKQYNSETEEYESVYVDYYDEKTGLTSKVEQGPLLDPTYVRMTVGYLKTFLNSNVYLSYIESMEQVNSIMWDVKKKLVLLLHPLKGRYDAKMVDVIGSMIENPIYMSLLRAYKKISLDAMSKQQHSVEHLNNSGIQNQNSQPKKPFKMFGF